MGNYLKQQYEMRDISKALSKVHRTIDEDYQKLYDDYHKYKLSHNRKVNLLKMCLKFVESPIDLNDAVYLHKRIILELYGLEGYEGLKLKGGK